MPDKVTISLYSFQSNNDFNRSLFNEKDNIAKIKAELTKAAKEAGREPPEFVVSISLIPDWTIQGNSYDNPNYLQLKQRFLQEAHENFDDLDVFIEDFYEDANLTKNEKSYLHGLEAKGSNADIIKTRAIINNKDCRHLQLDSNTKIPDYKKLYAQTFGAPVQQDALNAALYDTYFVSVHNKIVYTVPENERDENEINSSLATVLEHRYLDYCKEFKNKASDKSPTANSIYSKVFCPVMGELGLAKRFTSPKRPWPLYKADMSHPAYRITGSVVTSVNMSWRKNIPPHIQKRMEQLKSIPEIQMGNASCDSSVFTYLVKKYTVEGLPESEHKELLNLSDTQLDKEIIVTFYENARLNSNPDELQALAETFPNTVKGDELCQEIFGCDVLSLHKHPDQAPLVDVPSITIPNTAVPLIKKPASLYSDMTDDVFKEKVIRGFLNQIKLSQDIHQLNTIINGNDFLTAMEEAGKRGKFVSAINNNIKIKQDEFQNTQPVIQTQGSQPCAVQKQAKVKQQACWSKEKHQDKTGNVVLARSLQPVGYTVMVFDVKDVNNSPHKEFSFNDATQAANFAQFFSHVSVYQSGGYHKVALTNQQVVLLQKNLQKRQTFLNTSRFYHYLTIFNDKAQFMENELQNGDRSYVNAAPVARQLCTDLKAAEIEYLKSGDKTVLKTICQGLCTEAKNSSLKDHLDWMGAISKFIVDVLSFLSMGLTDSKLGMFSKTEPVKKIEEFEQSVVARIS